MDLRAAASELEALVSTLEQNGDARGLRLLELVDAIHRPALELIADGRLGHPLVRALLAMYELAEVEDALVVEEALDTLRERLGPAQSVDLMDVQEGVVRVRLRAAPPDDPGALSTLERQVEASLREGYPGFVEMIATAAATGIALPLAGPVTSASPAPPADLRLELVQHRPLRAPVLAEVARMQDIAPGTIAAVGGTDYLRLLLANVGGTIYAVRDACPDDGRPLVGGRLTGSVLVCPWHNCAWDVRSGRRADDSGGPGLAVVPVVVEGGTVRAAVDVR